VGKRPHFIAPLLKLGPENAPKYGSGHMKRNSYIVTGARAGVFRA
jgi:hypothetical protein